jgi:sirohydrochlorin cobaltochelatase
MQPAMTTGTTQQDDLATLERRLKTMLPAEYQDRYEDVQPVSMGSAGLKFDPDGRVAWNEIWQSFCDLAMAGGPPHKGVLLEPAPGAAIEASPDRHREVVSEICRAVTMVSDLFAKPSPTPGWVRVACFNETMAAWLLRAIVMENVAARCEGSMLDLPAGPHFRLEKEIKNVVTVIAKTCHYWTGHTSRAQQRAVANLFATLIIESPLIQPALAVDGERSAETERVRDRLAETIGRTTGLRASSTRYAGWLGFECPSVRAAIWMMRGLVVSNVLSRREGTVLFVPVDAASDPDGDRVATALARIYGFAKSRQVV